jgi:hypothetical protein
MQEVEHVPLLEHACVWRASETAEVPFNRHVLSPVVANSLAHQASRVGMCCSHVTALVPGPQSIEVWMDQYPKTEATGYLSCAYMYI